VFSKKAAPLSNYPYFAFALVILILGIFGDELNTLLWYQRGQVAAGQWWRLLTGCYVHLGLYHMTMNQLGFLTWQVLFGSRYSIRAWLLLVVSTSLANGIMLYLFLTPLAFYAGFSGVLHGLVAFSALLDYRRTRINIYIFAALWIKIIHEHTPLYDTNYLQTHMHAPVIVSAHLYGAIYGSILALVLLTYQKRVSKYSVDRVIEA
jgi:rhomboid family GlyGly-CTERM serine protease